MHLGLSHWFAEIRGIVMDLQNLWVLFRLDLFTNQPKTSMIPRAHSDPGAPRIDPIWIQYHPRLPTDRVYAQHIPPFTCSHTQIPSPELPKSEPKRRNWFMRILIAPCDCLEWAIKKLFSPTEGCMRCVKLTYWVVLIAGGIISAVVTIAPFR
jgi:hypothetical protein